MSFDDSVKRKIEEARTGDEDAFKFLVERYQMMALSVASGALPLHMQGEAADVVQETFAKAWLARNKMQSNPQVFGAWIRRICFRLCLDHARRKADQPVEDLDDIIYVEGIAQIASDERYGEAQAQIAKILEAQKPDCQLLLCARFVLGADPKELGRMLGEVMNPEEGPFFKMFKGVADKWPLKFKNRRDECLKDLKKRVKRAGIKFNLSAL